MSTRRLWLQAAASLPPLLALQPARAAADPSRLALVIGNSAYAQAPLANPKNDARAMADLFEDAGFTVYAQQNASLADMRATMERFGAATRDDKVKQVAFYYAGHGVQLDWRNYLLPVDAQVASAEQVRERCVDLNQLLEQFKAVRDKTFLIILDACRNNPFGHDFQPPQKGLSQFDAPAGSLIAYATAPGSVAADGEGKNGLYTEHLVRELSRRDTRVEDALKRVRLNVRLASKGSQVPWETTSLENDVFLFAAGPNKRSDSEIEEEIRRDMADWGRIRTSANADDFVAYLRQYPNGHFAEIAQSRLGTLLPAQPGQDMASAQAQAQATSSSTTPPEAPAIVIEAGSSMPQRLALTHNPYSAGRYPLGRVFTVGDEIAYVQTEILTGIEKAPIHLRVTRVDAQADRVEINGGAVVTDLMGNTLTSFGISYDVPVQIIPAEFQIGKKWRASFIHNQEGRQTPAFYDLHIARREQITVRAGTFDTFVIEGVGWNLGYNSHLKLTNWVVPGLNAVVRRERVVRHGAYFVANSRLELLSSRQYRTGI